MPERVVRGGRAALSSRHKKQADTPREDDLRKRFAALAFAAAIAVSSAASAQPLGIGTSPQGTLTYGLGASLSKVLADAGIQSRVQPQTGTNTVVPLVNSGEIDIGFANAAELYDAFHGVGIFDKRPNPKLRTVGIIFPLKAGLFVRADSGIKSIKDLKGKTMSYGLTAQENVRKTIDAMLATGGLKPSDLKQVMVPNVIRGVDELIAGRVDVTVFAIGSAKVAEADAAVGGIRFLPLENTPQALAALKKEFPTGYLDTVQPAPNLAGVKEPMVTMFYDYTVFANADLPAERVKTITQLIAENKDKLAQGQPSFRGLDPKRMYTSIDVPYHPGAVAYFKEKGVPEKK
jgi:TRAP transporter TAXI family solute receptor